MAAIAAVAAAADDAKHITTITAARLQRRRLSQPTSFTSNSEIAGLILSIYFLCCEPLPQVIRRSVSRSASFGSSVTIGGFGLGEQSVTGAPMGCPALSAAHKPSLGNGVMNLWLLLTSSFFDPPEV